MKVASVLAHPERLCPEAMNRLDKTNRARVAIHDDRVRTCPVAERAHTSNEIAVSDAGGDERDVIILDEIIHLEHFVDVVKPHLHRSLDLFFVARFEPAHKITAETAKR